MRICDDLRQAVLQAAIQGKLTKQLPEDGNAKDLLKLINTEKKKLIKEKKIKKEKDLPQITEDEIPFDIPDSWEFIRLGDYLFIKSGNGLTSKDFKNGSIPVYGGNGITGYHNKSNVSKGTVLIGRVGFYCGSVHITVSDAWATDNALIVSYLDCFYKEYLVLMLKAMNLGHKTEQTAQPVVTGKIIKPKVVPLPPLAEQQRIVARVDELMARIDDLEKTETELEKLKSAFPGDMKAALLQAAMQGKLTEQLPEDGDAADLLKQIKAEKEQLIKEKIINKEKEMSPQKSRREKPFDIPDNWTWTHLGEITFNLDSARVPIEKSIREKQTKKIYDYYGASGVIDRVENYLFDKKLMLIGEDGANLLMRSTPIAFIAEGKYWVNNHAHVLDVGKYLLLEYI